MGTTAQTLFFSVVMDYELILWGVRLAITQTEGSGIINDIQYTL